MTSYPDDMIATVTRRHSAPTVTWHPMLAAVEQEPGLWHMVAQYDNTYGVIELVRRGPEVGYKATTWAETPEARQLVGYYRTLSGACEAAHQPFVSGHGSGVKVERPVSDVMGK